MKKTVKKYFWICLWTALAAMAVYVFWLPWVPALKHVNPARTALMDLRQMQAAKKKKKLPEHMAWRNLDEISPELIRAVLLAEDDTFYEHCGFDFDQIWIAVKMNWEKKRYAYGGSTITQQLARTLYLSPSKRLSRKIKEAVLTLWLEHALYKKRILEIYLNVIEWGDGIYGAEAAARHYYRKSASELNAEESVALASILPSPRRWSPFKETPFMKKRRANLLSRMELRTPKSSETAVPVLDETIEREMPADDEEDESGSEPRDPPHAAPSSNRN